MKRYIFVVLILCFTCESNVFGQGILREFGRQLIEQELGRQQPQPGQQPKQRSQSLPSESGDKSGGNGNYDRGQGGDYLLPEGGGTPWPSNPRQTYPEYQPRMQTQPRVYPEYQQPQYLNYQEQVQPTYPQTQPRQGSFPQSNPTYVVQDIPRSPELSNQFISIRCPASAVGSIYYTLDSSRGSFGFSMSAGREQRFKVGSGWTISYDNGSGTKRYRLEGGKRYLLKPNAANQWQILAAK